ncbi:MAG: hypothetical protein HKN47_28660, partial [Pirellulaceae bacterium]|nr:hypothetical protein [Pirellulaceae bacterium]
MTSANDTQFQERMGRVETLVQQIEALPDPAARDLARRLTASLLDLHEERIRRM